MKKTKKNIKKAAIITLASAGVLGISTTGVLYLKKNSGKVVQVESVAMLNSADWISYGDEDGVSGTVVSNVSQNVRVPEDKVVDKVFVSEGDKVKVGDKLLSYDTTLLELDQELQELTVQELELEIKAAEADLKKLQNTTPVAVSNRSDSVDTGFSDSLSENDGSGLDSGDEEARLVGNDRMLSASQEQPVQEAQDAGDGQNASEVPAEGGGTPETGVQPGTEAAGQDETDSEIISTQETEAAEGEVVVGENSGETLTGEDLNNMPAEGESDKSAADQKETEKGSEDALKNQSLEPFFTNVRIKAVEEAGETLLCDTAEEGIYSVTVNSPLKLIPHFKETVKDHFQAKNTYKMLIRGVHLSEDHSGKIYGTAQINGEDYPEIGAYTLVQKADSDDTAILTMAFHEGLDQQHETGPELADLYAEIQLQPEEILPGKLTFCISDQDDKNKSVETIVPESETDAEEEISLAAEDPQEAATEPAEQIADAGEEDTPQTDAQQTEATESTENIVVPEDGKVKFNVIWKHGTNSAYNWPASLKVYFYCNEEDDIPAWTVDLMQKSVNPEQGSTAAGGEASIDEEDTTESAAETTEAESAAEGDTGAMGDTTTAAAPETEGSSEQPSESSETIPDAGDTAPAGVTVWKTIAETWPSSWPEGQAIPFMEEGYCWAYAPNYTPSITKDGASGTYTITMTYVEPAESPLQKLNAISEMNYQIGVNTEEGTGLRAYKGSGTAEDPYIFFVKDGVVIKNTFVNWVMGFNEDGTQRIGGGYYVRLEIRESDSITGAFIRSVDLDGTVQIETGYGPGTYWIFNSETGIVKYEEEVPEDPFAEGGSEGPAWDENDGETYTAEELAAAIHDKEQEIKKLNLDKREAELKLKKYNKDLDACVVKSAVNGYVQQIGGDSDDAYMVVSSEGGMYVKTTVSEMNLNKVSVDEEITCKSWDTGEVFTAKITQIEQFPDTSDNSMYFGSVNVNTSNYPVLAIVDESGGLAEDESVSVVYPTAGKQAGSIYLEKAYIRSENGQSYVYIADRDGRLKKQYIRTGSTVYGSVEIKSGLSEDDKIAFPYGKAVKEGTKTVYEEEE